MEDVFSNFITFIVSILFFRFIFFYIKSSVLNDNYAPKSTSTDDTYNKNTNDVACHICNGSGQIPCQGWHAGNVDPPTSCFSCSGNRFLQCYSCLGSGKR